MRRTILTIKQYDYTSLKEFSKHKIEMESKGYRLCNNNFGGMFNADYVIGNEEKWIYTASFSKDTM